MKKRSSLLSLFFLLSTSSLFCTSNKKLQNPQLNKNSSKYSLNNKHQLFINKLLKEYKNDKDRVLRALSANNKQDTLKFFLKKNSSLSLHKQDPKKGETSLHHAVKKKFYKIFCILVDRDTSALFVKNNKGKSAYDICFENQEKDKEYEVFVKKIIQAKKKYLLKSPIQEKERLNRSAPVRYPAILLSLDFDFNNKKFVPKKSIKSVLLTDPRIFNPEPSTCWQDLIGGSPIMLEIYHILRHLKRLDILHINPNIIEAFKLNKKIADKKIYKQIFEDRLNMEDLSSCKKFMLKRLGNAFASSPEISSIKRNLVIGSIMDAPNLNSKGYDIIMATHTLEKGEHKDNPAGAQKALNYLLQYLNPQGKLFLDEYVYELFKYALFPNPNTASKEMYGWLVKKGYVPHLLRRVDGGFPGEGVKRLDYKFKDSSNNFSISKIPVMVIQKGKLPSKKYTNNTNRSTYYQN